MEEFNCDECQDTGEIDSKESCKECCPHQDLDCGHCIDCGDEVDWVTRTFGHGDE